MDDVPGYAPPPRYDMTDIRKAFQDFDQDGNGKIDLVEFRTLVENLGMKLDRAEAEQLFDSIDEDETGLIDFEEFEVWYKQQTGA